MADRLSAIRELATIRDNYYKAVEKIMNDQPTIDVNTDIRIRLFGSSFSVLDTAILSLIYSHKYLTNISWWPKVKRDYALQPPKQSDLPDMIDGIDRIVYLSCFQFMFAVIEHAIRCILRQLDYNEYVKDEKFYNVSRSLLKKLNLTNYYDLIDILITIRNTIHNNGIYSPPYKNKYRKDKAVTFQGNKDVFKVDKPIQLKDFWLLTFDLLTEMLNMVTDIVNSKSIKYSTHRRSFEA